MQAAPKLRTAEEVRRDFERRGASISKWAREQGVNPELACHVVAGRLKAKRGQAHRIAVLLGMKEGVIEAATAEA